jgi:hypothetical protein
VFYFAKSPFFPSTQNWVLKFPHQVRLMRKFDALRPQVAPHQEVVLGLVVTRVANGDEFNTQRTTWPRYRAQQIMWEGREIASSTKIYS